MPSLAFMQVGDHPIKRISVVTYSDLSGDWFEGLNPAECRIVRETMADAMEQGQEWSKWSLFPSFRSSVNVFGTKIECIWQREED